MVAAAPTSPATPQPRRPANARGREQIQQARQLTNSVAKNATSDRLTETTKCRRDRLSSCREQYKPKGENNFGLLSPETRYATEDAASSHPKPMKGVG
jgi:hypothetical protein